MELKYKTEIMYSVDDIRALIEKHILDLGISSKGETYKMQFIVEDESLSTYGWPNYKFMGVEVTVESKE